MKVERIYSDTMEASMICRLIVMPESRRQKHFSWMLSAAGERKHVCAARYPRL